MKKNLIYSIFVYLILETLLANSETRQVKSIGNIEGQKVIFQTSADTLKAFSRNKTIGKGINIGNALEAPNEGDWGLVIQESYIEEIAKAGFNSVRLPICWSAHAKNTAPYSIDPIFLKRVDEIMGWCLSRKLAVIITIHHFNELYENPDNGIYRQKLLSIWEQLSNHYRGKYPETLIFEPLNEPHANLDAEKWNNFILEILKTIRRIEPDRTLIIDVPEWGYHGALRKLQIPGEEKNVIVSVRYYIPYDFTHQGAHWAEGSEKWMGLSWTGTPEEKNAVISHMNLIATWAKEHNRPITIGEYGAIIDARHEYRVIWTRFVRSQFEKFGFSWSYFDFGIRFRAYDINNHTWLKGFPGVFFD